MNKQKILRDLKNSYNAVVGIVVAVLLIGLIISVLSIVQLVYVPNWMEETESEHIDEVFNQFCQLKLVIDTQSINKQNFTPIVTSINLGTNKIPFLMSTRAYGGLDIISYDDVTYACTVSVTNAANGTVPYPLGAIRFTSANAYYIPDERISFIYENGALITNQKSGNALNIQPSFGFDDETDTIYFNLVNISGVGGKISKYGYNIEHIRTVYYEHKNTTRTFKDVTSLDIRTPHADAWGPFIINTLEKEGLNIDWDVSSTNVHIDFNEEDTTIELKITGIYAQIGPGWIEIQ